MGLNVSYRHFGNQAAAAKMWVERERGGGGGGQDIRGQQPWRLNQAEKRGNERG